MMALVDFEVAPDQGDEMSKEVRHLMAIILQAVGESQGGPNNGEFRLPADIFVTALLNVVLHLISALPKERQDEYVKHVGENLEAGLEHIRNNPELKFVRAERVEPGEVVPDKRTLN